MAAVSRSLDKARKQRRKQRLIDSRCRAKKGREITRDLSNRLRKSPPSEGLQVFADAALHFIGRRSAGAEEGKHPRNLGLWHGESMRPLIDVAAWFASYKARASDKFMETVEQFRKIADQRMIECGLDPAAVDVSVISNWDAIHERWRNSGLPASSLPLTPMLALYMKRPIEAPVEHRTGLMPRATLSRAVGRWPEVHPVSPVVAMALLTMSPSQRDGGLTNGISVPVRRLVQMTLGRNYRGKKAIELGERIASDVSKCFADIPGQPGSVYFPAHLAKLVNDPKTGERIAIFDVETQDRDRGGVHAPSLPDALLALCRDCKRNGPLVASVYAGCCLHYFRHYSHSGGHRLTCIKPDGTLVKNPKAPVTAEWLADYARVEGRPDKRIEAVRRAIQAIASESIEHVVNGQVVTQPIAMIVEAPKPRSKRGEPLAWHIQPFLPPRKIELEITSTHQPKRIAPPDHGEDS